MDTILPTKDTGVVTSVPSDSPDDFITLQQLAKSPNYGIEKEWAELEVTPITKTPSYGNLTAPFLVESLKISSGKDAKQLEHYQGIMTYGEFSRDKVEDAKPKVKKQLLDFDYREESWKNLALEYVANADKTGMQTYSNETKNAFEAVLNWLNQ